ncbi:MAG: hypothetical protein ACK4NR_01640 [Micavibrio sp.]
MAIKTYRHFENFILRPFLASFMIWGLLLCALLVTVPAKKALAICFCDGCPCSANEYADNTAENSSLHNETRFDEFGFVLPLPYYAYDTNGFIPIEGEPQGLERIGEHQEFVWQLWFDNFLPWWMYMSQQLTQNVMWHTFAIGTFIDAKHQLESQALFQERLAEIHKRYQPSVGMCVFGTNVRSLAASERQSDLTTHTMNERQIQRQLNREGSLGQQGNDIDVQGRAIFFMRQVCDRFDNNAIYDDSFSGFRALCETGPRTNGTVNMDVDFTRLVMLPRTLDVDFINPADPQNQRARQVYALAANLYGTKTLSMPNISTENDKSNESKMLDLRSVIAKRSVAQAPYNALVGLKARGTSISNSSTLDYMARLLEELGMSNADARTFIGERPSYYAQLELLAKKIYQNPDFYRELYDRPENTKRKSVAMSAIASMLDREIYDSQLRAEAIMSELLEMKLITSQEMVEDSATRKSDK